jgi:hypothetical protein
MSNAFLLKDKKKPHTKKTAEKGDYDERRHARISFKRFKEQLELEEARYA